MTDQTQRSYDPLGDTRGPCDEGPCEVCGDSTRRRCSQCVARRAICPVWFCSQAHEHYHAAAHFLDTCGDCGEGFRCQSCGLPTDRLCTLCAREYYCDEECQHYDRFAHHHRTVGRCGEALPRTGSSTERPLADQLAALRLLSADERNLTPGYSSNNMGDGPSCADRLRESHVASGPQTIASVGATKDASARNDRLPSSSCAQRLNEPARGESSGRPAVALRPTVVRAPMRPQRSPEDLRQDPATRRGSGRAGKLPVGPTRTEALSNMTLGEESRLHRPKRAAPSSNSLLQEAARRQALRKAEDSQSSPFFGNAEHSRLVDLFHHTQGLAEQGSAASTQRKDEIAWRHWLAYADYLKFDPHLSGQATTRHSAEVGTLLAGYLLFVYPRMQGKRGRRWAKPGSAFQYVLALLRCFARWSVPMPKAKVVRLQLRGLMRSFCDAYGPLALAATRKEPIKYPMIAKLLATPDGTKVGPIVWKRDSFIARQIGRLMYTMWRSAHRLGDLVGPGFTPRSLLTWSFDDVEYADPTRAQLLAARAGKYRKVVGRLSPGSTKPDQFGEIHAPFGSVLPFEDSEDSAGLLMLELELELPCHGKARESTPLFVDENGALLSHAFLDKVLHGLLLSNYDDAVARTHSWHSFRIGLCCALSAAGADDATIQLLCRWVSPESLRLYRRLGTQQMVDWVDRAQHVTVDTVQLANVPIVDGSEGFGALLQHCDTRLEQREARLRAELHRPPHAAPTRDSADAPASDDEEEEVAETTPLPDDRPLTQNNAPGRRVLVPRSIWPNYPCEEHNSAGWEASVKRMTTENGALVSFLHATTARGIPYEDVVLQLGVLSPL